MEEGIRFSQRYLERSAPKDDNPRFRKRLAAYIRENFTGGAYWITLKNSINTETGSDISETDYLYNFYTQGEISDILDSITVIYKTLKRDYPSKVLSWYQFINTILVEENMGYRVDDKCGVMYYTDEEYARNRLATLSGLQDRRYLSIREEYEKAYHFMDSTTPDTKSAVRSMFETIEILVKQMLPGEPGLTSKIVKNELEEKCIVIFREDNTGTKVLKKLFTGFAEWVDAVHFYRHGQNEEEPVNPSVEVAVYILSTGSSYLRWLLEMKEKLGED